MNDFWQSVLEFIQTTTKTVGSQLMQDFGKVLATRKDDGTLVTVCDQWADAEIRRAIAAHFPDHGVLTEETEHVFPLNDWCWIVDPIDGTTNFTRGIPIWGISVALVYKGTPVFGFVHFPPLQQSYWGYWYGDSGLSGPEGAYKNGEAICTSRDEPSNNHLFNLCARSTDVMKKPFPCKIRLLGVASYNILLVASGVALGGVEATPKIWDIAAAWVILKAAGGVYIALESELIFPLKFGHNYGSRSFPCLTVSKQELVSIFKPLVEFVSKYEFSKDLGSSR